MYKLFLSPTIGKSNNLPAEIRQFLLSEPCTYRLSCTKSQLAGLNPDVDPEDIASFSTGTEIVREIIQTIYGETEEVVSWDAEGERYYIEINNFEEDIDDLMMATGLRLTLDQSDRSTPHAKEFNEMIFGYPEIDEDAKTAELECSLTPRQEEETEAWKQ